MLNKLVNLVQSSIINKCNAINAINHPLSDVTYLDAKLLLTKTMLTLQKLYDKQVDNTFPFFFTMKLIHSDVFLFLCGSTNSPASSSAVSALSSLFLGVNGASSTSL